MKFIKKIFTKKGASKKKSNLLVINKKSIAPGAKKIVRLNVARLPSGTVISLRIHVYRSKKPGPVVLVLGGVHGDEINGVEIVRRAIENGLFENLNRGSIIAIPLLNVYGFLNFSRDASEGKDVNRNFPGNRNGSLAARVANTLTKKILPLIDFGIDFHTGGSARYNFPQIRYSKKDAKALALAKTFGAPYLIAKAAVPKSLRKVAYSMKKTILVYEGGESLRFDGFSIENGSAGLRRVLHAEGMIDDSSPPRQTPIRFNKTNWIRADRSGLFEWFQESGAKISAGEPLGVINDPYGESSIRLYAKKDGYIIGHNNAPVVSEGDALFHIGIE